MDEKQKEQLLNILYDLITQIGDDPDYIKQLITLIRQHIIKRAKGH